MNVDENRSPVINNYNSINTKKYRTKSMYEQFPMKRGPIASTSLMQNATLAKKRKSIESSYSERIKSTENALWVSAQLRRNKYAADSDDDNEYHNSPFNNNTINPQQASIFKPLDHVSKVFSLRPPNYDPQELLVPIRLELDIEGNRIQDVFAWNVYDSVTSPELFAHILCNDLRISLLNVPTIVESIRQQLSFYLEGSLTNSLESDEQMIVINLDINIGRTVLRDRIIWDMSPDNNITPETFARQMCEELGLGLEFAVLISHSIREQIGRKTFQVLQEDSLRYGFRDIAFLEHWQPEVTELDDEELELKLKANERESRRLRRESTKFGGVRRKY
jgi:hypothetical protein